MEFIWALTIGTLVIAIVSAYRYGRREILWMYADLRYICGERVYNLNRTPRLAQLFLIGIKQHRVFLDTGRWYMGLGIGSFKVEAYTYTRWDKVTITYENEFGQMAIRDVSQSAVDNLYLVEVPLNRRQPYQTYQCIDPTRIAHYIMPNGDIIMSTSYQEAMMLHELSHKKSKKKYPQRRKHGVK